MLYRYHTFSVPPRFLDDDFPSKLSVVEGDDVSLMCRVSGDPHPTVEWMKDGVPLGDQDTYELSETGDLLTISGNATPFFVLVENYHKKLLAVLQFHILKKVRSHQHFSICPLM